MNRRTPLHRLLALVTLLALLLPMSLPSVPLAASGMQLSKTADPIRAQPTSHDHEPVVNELVRVSSAVTDLSGQARITVDGQEVTFRPYDPEMPGLPLPYIRITAQEYATHAIFLWEDTLAGLPPFYSPAVDFVEKPIAFSTHLRPLTVAPEPSYSVFLPLSVRERAPALATARQAPVVLAGADDQSGGWDIADGQIYPNTLTEYVGPEATIPGTEFATYMIEHHPDAKSFVFYHYGSIPSVDEAEMDIFETVDEGVIAVRLRLKDEEPSSHAESVVTHTIWENVFAKISLEACSFLASLAIEGTMQTFEYVNSKCIPVPDVTGRDRGEARTLLQQMGFEVEELETYTEFPEDQVIDQDFGPDDFSKCRLPGRSVTIEVSLGPAPSDYELYYLSVTTTRNRTGTVFEPGETVVLSITGVNHTGTPLSVSYNWQTIGPDDEQVAALSRSNWVKQEASHQRSTQSLQGTAPALCGEYTFVGSASFTPEGGTEKTAKRQVYFRVGGTECVMPQANHPPNQPAAPSPVDGATDQAQNVTLGWTGGDPDGDPVTYDVYLEAGDTAPDVLVSDDQAGTSYAPATLSAGTRYSWQIVAQDALGATTAGPVWRFQTAVPEPQDGDMHLLAQLTDEPECYPPCVTGSPLIVQYILPLPDHCGSVPYPGDPDEIVWSPGQANVESDLHAGDIVEVYGRCWLDLGVYPAVSVPPDAPYFLRKTSVAP